IDNSEPYKKILLATLLTDLCTCFNYDFLQPYVIIGCKIIKQYDDWCSIFSSNQIFGLEINQLLEWIADVETLYRDNFSNIDNSEPYEKIILATLLTDLCTCFNFAFLQPFAIMGHPAVVVMRKIELNQKI
uniref:Uncharacterized protein n=1 Tax=Romanomermis culicivorax TaxID=13658 RepID=A0A915L2Z4_ROMCU